MMDKLWRRDSGPQRFWRPLSWKRSTYNSVLLTMDALALGDSFSHVIGIILLGEAILVSIEGCWRARDDD